MDKVCHFEIPYSDKSRAEKFYQDVFGWQVQDAGSPNPYSFAITTPVNEQFQPTETGGINGGMYQRDDEVASNSPVIVIQVESCDQRIKDVADAGSEHILGPHEIPGMGLYAQVKDCEDNIIGLWQPLKR